MKRCTKCGELREPCQFCKDKSRQDGLQPWCKYCQEAYRKAHKAEKAAYGKGWKKHNPEKVKASTKRWRDQPEVKQARAAYNKKWKKDNPEKVKAQQKRSYANHAEKRKENARRYAVEHPVKVKEAKKKWREKNLEHIKKHRKENRHRDREYYARNKEEIRRKKESRKKWVVYRIDFQEGDFYLGSSSHVDLRFNAHKSLSSRGLHISSLNHRAFNTDTLSVLSEHPGEESALEAEARAIQQAWDTQLPCLNQTLPALPKNLYWVYVIQSLAPRQGRQGPLPGFFYVGMTTNPSRRLREHNGLYANGKTGNPNGGKYTSKFRPWEARSLHGPYFSRSEALRAEYALKRGKRGMGRLNWTSEDSLLFRGEGTQHQWVSDPTGWEPPSPEEWRRTGKPKP